MATSDRSLHLYPSDRATVKTFEADATTPGFSVVTITSPADPDFKIFCESEERANAIARAINAE